MVQSKLREGLGRLQNRKAVWTAKREKRQVIRRADQPRRNARLRRRRKRVQAVFAGRSSEETLCGEQSSMGLRVLLATLWLNASPRPRVRLELLRQGSMPRFSKSSGVQPLRQITIYRPSKRHDTVLKTKLLWLWSSCLSLARSFRGHRTT